MTSEDYSKCSFRKLSNGELLNLLKTTKSQLRRVESSFKDELKPLEQGYTSKCATKIKDPVKIVEQSKEDNSCVNLESSKEIYDMNDKPSVRKAIEAFERISKPDLFNESILKSKIKDEKEESVIKPKNERLGFSSEKIERSLKFNDLLSLFQQLETQGKILI